MMPLVANDDIGESANAYSVVVGNSLPLPNAWRQVLKEIELGLPNRLELGDQVDQRMIVKLGSFYVGVFVEAGQWCEVAACDAQRGSRKSVRRQ